MSHLLASLCIKWQVRCGYLKASPTGDIHRTKCRFCCTRSTKAAWMASLVGARPWACRRGRMMPEISSRSSGLIRLGTSPLFRMLLMSCVSQASTLCQARSGRPMKSGSYLTLGMLFSIMDQCRCCVVSHNCCTVLNQGSRSTNCLLVARHDREHMWQSKLLLEMSLHDALSCVKLQKHNRLQVTCGISFVQYSRGVRR